MTNKRDKEHVCIECGKKWISWNKNIKFCNNICFNNFKYHEYIRKWKNGLVSGGTRGGHGKVSKHVRKYIFDKYDDRCCICGWSEINKFTNTKPLQIEHINGNPEDHREENLKLLCPNCHSLTFGHSTKKGNGRRYYREQYLRNKHA
jgi:hypothetical protein